MAATGRVVLEGETDWEIEGRAVRARAGDFVFARRGTSTTSVRSGPGRPSPGDHPAGEFHRHDRAPGGGPHD